MSQNQTPETDKEDGIQETWGRWSISAVGDALNARDRKAAGPTAPPEGLYLVAIRYTDWPISR